MRRGMTVTTLCLLVSLFCVEALAEIRVMTDRRGEYKMTQVVTGGDDTDPKVWAVVGRGTEGGVLNPDGDRNGDLWPAIVESNADPHYPWVIWSRFNGTDYDLAWSRWEDGSWESIQWLGASATSGDDLDPDFSFDDTGVPYVVWWRDEGGSGTVYLAKWGGTEWHPAHRVSPTGLDSRYPRLQQIGVESVMLAYETPAGPVEQTIEFLRPVTITEDIDPITSLSPPPSQVEQEP